MKKGIKEKDIRDFIKYAEKLKELMERIHKYHPDAELFLNINSLQLLCSEPFSDGDTEFDFNGIVVAEVCFGNKILYQ